VLWHTISARVKVGLVAEVRGDLVKVVSKSDQGSRVPSSILPISIQSLIVEIGSMTKMTPNETKSTLNRGC
jgi:hypothetical protein